MVYSAKLILVQNFPTEGDMDSFMMLQISGGLFAFSPLVSFGANSVVGRHYSKKPEILM